MRMRKTSVIISRSSYFPLRMEILYVLLLAVGGSAVGTLNFADSCPTWFHHSQEEPNKCECGSSLEGAVLCNNVTHEVSILDCFCMTLNGETSNTTVVGKCVFNCANQSNPSVDVEVRDVLYHPVYPNVTDLNDKSCGYLNRKGRLCGKCRDNHYVTAYSYSFKCIKCSKRDWIRYIAIAFIPLTGFYFLITIFSLSVTSPKIKPFFYFAQFIASAPYVRIILLALDSINALVRTIFTLYGFWNLDFFRTIIHSPCLKLPTLHVLTLDYVVAGYPLLLVTVTYLLVTLYGRDYPLITKLWRPFHRFFIRFKRQWNLKSSIIGVFATFLLLSNEKLLSVSFDLLIPTRAYNMKGEMVGVYLYYDPSVEYMGKEHRIFACIAIIILTVTVLLPLILLILYPMVWFQRFLNRFHLNCESLRVFMDCFQGYYRNHTEDGRDFRYIAAMFFLGRPLLFISYAVTLNAVFYVLAFIIFTLLGIGFLICRPYKKKFSVYNKVEATMILLLAVHSGGMILLTIAGVLHSHPFTTLGLIILLITAMIPLLYISAITLHWMYSRRRHAYVLGREIFNMQMCHCRRVYYGSTDGQEQNQLCDPNTIIQ